MRFKLQIVKNIVVGNWQDARRFRSPVPYAIISFVSTTHHRTAPKIVRSPELRGRIIIEADDAVPHRPSTDGYSVTTHVSEYWEPALFSKAQARRIAHFLRRVAPRIDTLFIHCVFGEGRSAAAALAIAKAYGLSHEQYRHAPYAPNPWIVRLLDEAFTELNDTKPSETSS